MRELAGEDEVVDSYKRAVAPEVGSILKELHFATLGQLLQETIDNLVQVQRRINLY
jgi:hypothetical protein